MKLFFASTLEDFMSSRAARRIDEDECSESAEPSPEEFLQKIFYESASFYFWNLHPRMNKTNPGATFLGRLSNRESAEHRRQFLVFVLTLALRQVFPREEKSFSAQEESPKLKSDLSILFSYASWDVELMLGEADNSNEVARLICDVLQIDSRFRDCGRNKGHIASDALSELRLRLRRGGLWRDEPWWPQPPKAPGEQAESEPEAELK